MLSRALAEKDIEPLTPLTGCLDVLAQIIISLTAQLEWPLDDLYTLLRRSAPYHDLSRDQFDLVIEMLAGRYAGSRVRELKPRISYDRIHGTVKGAEERRARVLLPTAAPSRIGATTSSGTAIPAP